MSMSKELNNNLPTQQYEELLRENQLLKERLINKQNIIANFNHEVRTPANTILGLIELMFDESNPNKRDEYLKKVWHSCDQLRTVTDNIRQFTNLNETTVSDQEMSTFSPVQLLERILIQFADKAAVRNNSLSLNFAASIKYNYHSYVNVFHEILQHLIDNAIKFTENGHVQVSMEFKDQQLHFIVADTGIGISLDKQEEVFKPYVQEDYSSTRMYAGVGLGLTISKVMAEKLSGDLSLDAEYKLGTKISVTLPATQELALSDSTSFGSSAAQQNFIVCCEDSYTQQYLMSYLSYFEADSIQLCTVQEVGAVLSDEAVLLADLEALKKLRLNMNNDYSKVSIILFTSSASQPVIADNLLANIVRMPFTTELFLSAVTEKTTSPTTKQANTAPIVELTLDENAVQPLISHLSQGDYDRSLLELQKLKPAFSGDMQSYYQLKEAIESYDFSDALTQLDS